MVPDQFPGVVNPISYYPVTNRVIEPAHPNAFFIQRKLKAYDGWKLQYTMSALTNGPHLTSGVLGEITPKRGVLNNDRPLHYVDTNFGQELSNCNAVLFVSYFNEIKINAKQNLYSDSGDPGNTG